MTIASILPRCFTPLRPMAGEGYRLVEIAEHWGSRGGHVVSMGWLYAALAGVSLLVGSIAAFRWLRRRRLEPGPAVLLRRLSKRLDMGPTDRRLLHRIASRQRLPSALVLLCSPATFTFHAERHIRTVPAWRRHRTEQRIRSLSRVLFGPAS